MPFKSKKQQRKCYAMKAKGQSGSWDCSEWSKETNFKKLPERKKKAAWDTANYLKFAASKTPGLSDGYVKVAKDLFRGASLPVAIKQAFPNLRALEVVKIAKLIIDRTAGAQRLAKQATCAIAPSGSSVIRIKKKVKPVAKVTVVKKSQEKQAQEKQAYFTAITQSLSKLPKWWQGLNTARKLAYGGTALAGTGATAYGVNSLFNPPGGYGMGDPRLPGNMDPRLMAMLGPGGALAMQDPRFGGLVSGLMRNAYGPSNFMRDPYRAGMQAGRQQFRGGGRGRRGGRRGGLRQRLKRVNARKERLDARAGAKADRLESRAQRLRDLQAPAPAESAPASPVTPAAPAAPAPAPAAPPTRGGDLFGGLDASRNRNNPPAATAPAAPATPKPAKTKRKPKRVIKTKEY